MAREAESLDAAQEAAMGDVLDRGGGRLLQSPGEMLTGSPIAQMPPAVRAGFAKLLANDWLGLQRVRPAGAVQLHSAYSCHAGGVFRDPGPDRQAITEDHHLEAGQDRKQGSLAILVLDCLTPCVQANGFGASKTCRQMGLEPEKLPRLSWMKMLKRSLRLQSTVSLPACAIPEGADLSLPYSSLPLPTATL